MTFRPKGKLSLMLPRRQLNIVCIVPIAMPTLLLLAVVLHGRIEHLSRSHLLALPHETSHAPAEAADNIRDVVENDNSRIINYKIYQ